MNAYYPNGGVTKTNEDMKAGFARTDSKLDSVVQDMAEMDKKTFQQMKEQNRFESTEVESLLVEVIGH